MRPKAILGFGLAVVITSSGVGWVAGRQIRSPAEIAARTSPPVPSLITVPVEKVTLTSDVVTRGIVRYGAPQAVSLAASALKKATGIVTMAPTKGATVIEGNVALAVSGRPVFLLQGAKPAYRDLGPGAIGDDVGQLEESLHRLGFDPGPIDGAYDSRTGSAVAAWYQAAGWTALGPTEEQLQAQRTVQSDLSTTSSDLLAAEEGLITARGSLSGAEERARVARAAAQAAPAVEAASRAKADSERLAAAAEVASRMAARDGALGDQRVAQLRLDGALSADPPLSPAEMAALDEAERQARANVGATGAALVAAQAAASAVPASPAPGTVEAEAAHAVTVADGEVSMAAEAVRVAQRRVAVTSARAALGGPLGTTTGGLGDPTRRLGTQVPADEVLFFPTLPLRIDDVKVKPGDAVTGPVMTVTNSRLAIDAALSAVDAKIVHKGAAATITEPERAVRATGSVTDTANTPGTRGVDPQRFYMEVTPADVPASLVGATVLLTITVESTGGEVLAVPVTAVSLAGDGTSRVQVMDPSGSANGTRGPTTRTRFVTVVPGLAAKGLVAVMPVGARLAPGDLVGVGTATGTAPGARSASAPVPPTTPVPSTTPGGTHAP